jgi:hypothetical protein
MKQSMLAGMTCLGMLAGLATAPGAAMAQSVVTYHNSPDRSGDFTVPGLTLAAAAKLHKDTGFSASITGNVNAQPLYWKPAGAKVGLLIVATESNSVYALNASTGAQVWKTQLAAPMPNPYGSGKFVQCGNIDPEGITGAPVIDPATGTLYLDAMTLQSGTLPRQMIYALSLSTGKVRPNWPLNVDAAMSIRHAIFSSKVQGQRSALQLFKGRLYVTYAGRAGDCGDYHGTVIEVKTAAKPSISGSWATRAVGGGIWAQGGVASDGVSLFATTGNTFGASDWADGEAVFRFGQGLARPTKAKDFFTPVNWKGLDNVDLDLGGTMALPITVPVGSSGTAPRVLAFGKDGHAYLLNAANLGGIGQPLKNIQVSNAEIVTAPAVYKTILGTLVAFSDRNGMSAACSGRSLTVLKVSGATDNPMLIDWCRPLSGFGAPILTTTNGIANAVVWVAAAEGDNQIHGFNALNGKTVFGGAGTEMTGLHHFGTLIAANRHIYVAGDSAVFAFTF